MAITLLRRQSETPTVLGQDDSRILRYATGGYDGVTEGYADECGYTTTGSTLHIKSGEIILNGWQAVIDGSGVDVTLGSSATKLYFSIYVEYDLRIAAEPVITIKSQYDTASYPDIAVGEDLTENPYGIRRMLLYTATGQNNTISDVTRKFELCEVGKIKNAVNSTNASKVNNKNLYVHNGGVNIDGFVSTVFYNIITNDANPYTTIDELRAAIVAFANGELVVVNAVAVVLNKNGYIQIGSTLRADDTSLTLDLAKIDISNLAITSITGEKGEVIALTGDTVKQLL